MRKPLRSPSRTLILGGLGLALVALFCLPGMDADAAFSASLSCEPDFGGAYCEASPVGSTYNYVWLGEGAIGIPSSCNSGSGSAFCHVTCGGSSGSGEVHVTVTKPNGASDSASRYIQCSGGL